MFCSLRLPGNLRILIAERPGLWMRDSDLEDWARPCREIAQASLDGKELDYGVFQGSGPFWSEAIITLIEDRTTGQALAFNVMRLLPVQLGGRAEDVLHLGLTMVAPAARGKVADVLALYPHLRALLFSAAVSAILDQQREPSSGCGRFGG